MVWRRGLPFIYVLLHVLTVECRTHLHSPVTQVVVDETLSATTGPHENAPGILQQLPPYSVAAAVRHPAKRR